MNQSSARSASPLVAGGNAEKRRIVELTLRAGMSVASTVRYHAVKCFRPTSLCCQRDAGNWIEQRLLQRGCVELSENAKSKVLYHSVEQVKAEHHLSGSLNGVTLLMSSLCITTSFTADFQSIGEYAAMAIRAYAAFHDASVYIDGAIDFTERPAPWHRIRLIPELFNRGAEYVFWVDADTTFVRYDVDIRSVIMPDKDLYLVQHDIPKGGLRKVPNTGVMLLRNSAWTHHLLERLWALKQYINHPWWENAAMIHLLGLFSLLDGREDVPSDITEHVSFLPIEWNSLPGLCSAWDPIIVHYAGQSKDVREQSLTRDTLRGCLAAISQLQRSRNDTPAF